MKKKSLLLFAAALLFAFACSTEKQNIINGQIDGLEAGDRIILSVEDSGGSVWASWIAVDSTIVTKAGEFTIKTKVHDDFVRITRLKVGEKFNATNKGPLFSHYFLEAYATLHVTGNVDEWDYLKITGGIYDHPDMREINRITDSALVFHKEGRALLEQSQKTGDTALQRKGIDLVNNQAAAIFSTAETLEQEFVKKNPDKAYSAALLRHDYDLMMKDINKYEAAFHALSPTGQNSPVGIWIKNYIADFRASEVDATAPDFSLKALDRQEITLSKFRGKYILLDFWGSWCGPCRISSPLLVELYKSLKEKEANIEFIGIACDEQKDADWTAAIERDNLAWIHLNDSHSEQGKSIQKQYSIIGVPTCVLVSPEGTIVYKEHPVRIIPKIKELFGISHE